MKEYYLIRVNRDPRITSTDMVSYIREAVIGWKGQYGIDDPRRLIGKATVKRVKGG